MDETTELRLVGVSEDGQRLVLADPTGAEVSVAIDERLRAAVNGHLSRLGQLTMALESRISPKEIQTRVRAGESAEHVALTAGVPLERVLRFVGPVLREREHIAEQARRARLAVPAGSSNVTPGQHGSSLGPVTLLGETVDRACRRRELDPADVGWDSARHDDHSWVITATFPDGTVASWSFDVLRHQVAPLDAAARGIGGLSEQVAEAAQVQGMPDVDGGNVRQFARRPLAATQPAPVEELTFEEFAQELAAAGAPSGPAEPDPVDIDAEHGDPVDAEPPAAAPPVQPTSPPAAGSGRPGGRPKRASVPNWDDIVFGMKPKD